MKSLEVLQSWQSEAQEIRRSIHQHPELGFEEQQTQKTINDLLTRYGVDSIDLSFAKTAVVATIKGNLPGPMIGLRADIDALPVTEENTFDHRSQHQGTMHACGHDGHTTMLLMAAKYLASYRDFAGTAVLFFQPAEEGRGGAETLVLKEQVLQKYPVEAVYAMHNWPSLPAGSFAIKPGSIMASSDRIFIDIKGKSGHAAQPHHTQDPLLVATHIYQGVQGLVARTIDPLSPIVVAITQLHVGETTNAIAGTAKMAGTIRTHNEAVRADILAKLTALVENMGAAFGMEASIKLGPVSHPVTVNTEAEAARAIAVATELVGPEHVVLDITEQMTSEDFAFFLQEVPGCYLFIGNGDQAEGHSVGLHNSHYDFNDAIIPLGASFLVEVVRSYQQAI
ncbi:amidohydrolase [Ignatzschineria larvae DSM 13226]|uniref:Amidohydrolase n=1 Tax=Ignatzschineria larvae DSM 13226 TaxID=1111732 RepID=A0ABZ3BYJ2_9GAMM|nr:amidohydrolase [Ignatzschineria larvae]